MNDVPVAAEPVRDDGRDTAKPITLSATDVEARPLDLHDRVGPAHGTLSGTAPALTYTPAPNFNGTDSFTFKANDGTGD